MVSSEIRVQTVNHLGIIAGLIDEIGVVEQIDQLLGRHPKEVVSAKVGDSRKRSSPTS